MSKKPSVAPPIFSNLLKGVELNVEGVGMPMPAGIHLMWLATSPAFQERYNIDTRVGFRRFIGWWIVNGWRYHPGVPLEASMALLRGLEAIEPSLAPSVGLGEIALCLHTEWSYLHEKFPLEDAQARAAFAEWWDIGRRSHFPLIALYEDAVMDEEAKAPYLAISPYQDAQAALDEGVNVIGIGRGVLGIGEDARRVFSSLLARNIPVSLFHYPREVSCALTDERYANFIGSSLRRRVNLFALPAFETMQAVTELGIGAYRGRYTIGYWPWELPRWPASRVIAFDTVDEIWASSQYTRGAFAEAGARTVLHMPFAVEIDEQPIGDRKRFGFGDEFVFLSIVDGNSHLLRKNPEGAVRAFLAAFPSSRREPVRLIIKAMNVARRTEWRPIQELAAQDSRIDIMDRLLDRAELFGLMASSDALISLHRAEGFGRCPAEAMLLNKPVIATAFSGNMDYCTPDTAFLVDYDLVRMSARDYPLSQGQVWAEPRLDSAVAALRACFENAVGRERKARLGMKRIRELYSTEAASKRYRDRLTEVGVL